MKCMSCQEDVPTKFVHAIAMNCCPLCGRAIMQEDLQESLIILGDVMSVSIDKYQQEIFDWLKSNYNLIPQAEVNQLLEQAELKWKESYTKPVAKSAKKFQQNQNSESEGEVLQTEETTNKFFQNAGVKKILSPEDVKSMVKQIQGNPQPMPLVDEEGVPLATEPLDSEELEQVKKMVAGDLQDLDSGDGEDNFNEPLPSVVMAMQRQAQNGNSQSAYQRDLETLARIQGKSKKASNAMNRGGGIGKINRA